MDKITDELEREATVGIIHNCELLIISVVYMTDIYFSTVGQTPRKLFNTPHPDRMMHGASTLPIGSIYGIAEDYHLLSQSTRATRGEIYCRFMRQKADIGQIWEMESQWRSSSSTWSVSGLFPARR